MAKMSRKKTSNEVRRDISSKMHFLITGTLSFYVYKHFYEHEGIC